MPSWTAIANRALGAINEKAITDWQSTTEKGAIEFRKVKDMIVEEILASHPWNCALQRLSLSADVAAPTWGFAAQYTLPAGVLRVWGLSRDQHGPAEYKVLAGKIHTDEGAPLYVEAIMTVDDPMDFPPLLAKAIAMAAAEALALRMTGSASRREEMQKVAQAALDDARFADGQEGKPDEVEASTFEDERF